ncbi:MAG: hypothetical protein WCS72_15260, partial [Deltaproteobacteria bacterium]
LGILTSGIGSYDLSQFLIGPQLTADQVASWVSPQLKAGSQGNYISDVFLENGGIYTGSGPHAYADLQLLNAMETLFGQAMTQYTAYGTVACAKAGATDCSEARATLLTQMQLLKGNIIAAILAFYQNYGDGFASRIEGANEANAVSTTQYYSSSTNTENGKSWGLSASVKGIIKGAVLGGGGSGGQGSYEEWGGADAWNDANTSATSKPAGVVDTTAWAHAVLTATQNIATAGKMTVPPINVPAATPLTPPDLVGELKDWTAPPDTCFKSFKQWKSYQLTQGVLNATSAQERIKAGKDISDFRNALEALGAAGPVGGGLGSSPGLGQPTGDRVLMQPVTASIHNSIVREFAKLGQLRQAQARKSAATTDFPLNNVVRIPSMYTSGFDYTPYGQVFPELRPQLDIPDSPLATFAGYPNAITLLMAEGQIGALRAYVAFLSNYGASNVTPAMVASMEAMYQVFTQQLYATLEASLQGGGDVTNAARLSFAQAMFGTKTDMSDGALYQAVGNADVFFYLYHLLDPAPKKIWMTAAGGYVPFAFDASGKLGFMEARGSGGGQVTQAINFGLTPVVNPTTTPLSFYANTQLPQSPLYPIFAYLGNQGMNLLFLQTIGPLQMIYGRHLSQLPILAYSMSPLSLPHIQGCAPPYWMPVTVDFTGNSTQLNPWSWAQGGGGTGNCQAAGNTFSGWTYGAYPTLSMWDPVNSFLGAGTTSDFPYVLPGELSWDYYLGWPMTSQLADYNVLALNIDASTTYGQLQTGNGSNPTYMAGFGQQALYGNTLNVAPTAVVWAPSPVISSFTGPASARAGDSITLTWDVSYASTLLLTYCDGSTHDVTADGGSATATMLGNPSCSFTLTAKRTGVPQAQQTIVVAGVGQSSVASGTVRNAVGRGAARSSLAIVATTWTPVDLVKTFALATNGVRLLLLPVNETTAPGWGSIVDTNYSILNTQPAVPFQALIRDGTSSVSGTFDDAYNRGLMNMNADACSLPTNPNCGR